MKRILITGENSFIGNSFQRWLGKPEFSAQYQVDTVDMQSESWRSKDFSRYDSLFHVAGIAHADVGKITKEQRMLYYTVNCDLAVETARKAKQEGVKQFIYMSSIIVYGTECSVKRRKVIQKSSLPAPSNCYGDSKRKAELGLLTLEEDHFRVAILRPPMIYGRGCKGNYRLLEKIALSTPVFPDFPNERSVLSIQNLCECVRRLTDNGEGGIYLPQNPEYMRTSEMVRRIAQKHGRKIYVTPALNWIVYLASHLPGKAGGLVNKAFGSLVYERE